MTLLTEAQKEDIKKRRGYICDKDGRKHRSGTLIIHHKDRNPHNNDPANLRVLCDDCHTDLHSKD